MQSWSKQRYASALCAYVMQVITSNGCANSCRMRLQSRKPSGHTNWRERCAEQCFVCAYVLLCTLNLHVDATQQINIAQDLVLHCAVSIAVGLTHRLAQDAELEQASTAITAKVCFFRIISLSQRDRHTHLRRMRLWRPRMPSWNKQ